LIQKKIKFLSQFLVSKALDLDWIRIRIGFQPKMLDPDPDEMNADPQPWKKYKEKSYFFASLKSLKKGVGF
jgi:hypothetical protein